MLGGGAGPGPRGETQATVAWSWGGGAFEPELLCDQVGVLHVPRNTWPDNEGRGLSCTGRDACKDLAPSQKPNSSRNKPSGWHPRVALFSRVTVAPMSWLVVTHCVWCLRITGYYHPYFC